jgi:hypothetical protein
MKTRHRKNNNHYKKYKDKYVSVKDIYNTIKHSVRVKSERGSRILSYGEYYSILSLFLDEVIHTVGKEQEVFKMPLRMGEMYTKRLPHRRPFHVRIDVKETAKKGEVVLYKVPILDDEYTKVWWDRPYKYSKYKVLPLKRFKEQLNR